MISLLFLGSQHFNKCSENRKLKIQNNPPEVNGIGIFGCTLHLITIIDIFMQDSTLRPAILATIANSNIASLGQLSHLLITIQI